MNDQTFLPSVSTLLSKDSVPVAVVTSVLDLEQLLYDTSKFINPNIFNL